MFFQNPILSLIGMISGLLYYLLRNGIESIKKVLWMIFLIPIALMVINPLFMHNGVTPLFILNDNPITLEATLFGLSVGIMAGSVLLWFASFNQIMTSDKLLYIFGSISPKIALILSMTLRYIPLFKQQITKTNNAQKAMGLYKEDNAIDKIKGSIRVFSVMVSWALENGVITADSMAARGYGVGKRSRFAIFRWSVQDKMLMAASIGLAAIVVGASFIQSFRFNWYPAIIQPEITPVTLTGYILFAILCMIPEYLHIKEEARWRSLQSKI